MQRLREATAVSALRRGDRPRWHCPVSAGYVVLQRSRGGRREVRNEEVSPPPDNVSVLFLKLVVFLSLVGSAARNILRMRHPLSSSSHLSSRIPSNEKGPNPSVLSPPPSPYCTLSLFSSSLPSVSPPVRLSIIISVLEGFPDEDRTSYGPCRLAASPSTSNLADEI